MNRALWKKTISEAQLLFYSCAAILYLFGWIRVWLTSQLDMSRFEGMLSNLPEQWLRMSPVPLEQLATYPGRIAMAYDDPMVVLIVSAWAITRGSDVVSGPLGRGTLEMILAQPVSRVEVLISHCTVTVVGAGLLCLTVWAGTVTGIATCWINEEPEPISVGLPLFSVDVSQPGTMRVPLGPFSFDLPVPGTSAEPRRVPISEKAESISFLPAVFNLFALSTFLAGFTVLMSSWDRYRWRTIGIVVGVYVTQVMLKGIGMAAEGWEWLLYCTFFSAFEPEAFVALGLRDPAQAWTLLEYSADGAWIGLGPVGYDLFLITSAAMCFVVAALIFTRRDLPAPI